MLIIKFPFVIVDLKLNKPKKWVWKCSENQIQKNHFEMDDPVDLFFRYHSSKCSVANFIGYFLQVLNEFLDHLAINPSLQFSVVLHWQKGISQDFVDFSPLHGAVTILHHLCEQG